MVSCNVDSNSRICANQVCITLQILNAKLPTIKPNKQQGVPRVIQTVASVHSAAGRVRTGPAVRTVKTMRTLRAVGSKAAHHLFQQIFNKFPRHLSTEFQTEFNRISNKNVNRISPTPWQISIHFMKCPNVHEFVGRTRGGRAVQTKAVQKEVPKLDVHPSLLEARFSPL